MRVAALVRFLALLIPELASKDEDFDELFVLLMALGLR